MFNIRLILDRATDTKIRTSIADTVIAISVSLVTFVRCLNSIGIYVLILVRKWSLIYLSLSYIRSSIGIIIDYRACSYREQLLIQVRGDYSLAYPRGNQNPRRIRAYSIRVASFRIASSSSLQSSYKIPLYSEYVGSVGRITIMSSTREISQSRTVPTSIPQRTEQSSLAFQVLRLFIYLRQRSFSQQKRLYQIMSYCKSARWSLQIMQLRQLYIAFWLFILEFSCCQGISPIQKAIYTQTIASSSQPGMFNSSPLSRARIISLIARTIASILLL